MTDAPDLSDLTAEDTAMLSQHVEEVQAEAKQRFNLKDRLKGRRLATAKIVVFLDQEAAQEYALAEEVHRRMGAIVGQQEQGSEAAQAALVDFNEFEEERLAPARERAFEGALAIHMRAVPQVALDAAERKAKAAYADGSGHIPDESRERYFQMQDRLLFGSVVQRVVDHTGAEAEIDRETLIDDLREALPGPQFKRVMDSYNALIFNDALARAATADPGF